MVGPGGQWGCGILYRGAVRDVPVLVRPKSLQGDLGGKALERQSAIDRATGMLTKRLDLLGRAPITAADTGELDVVSSLTEEAL